FTLYAPEMPSWPSSPPPLMIPAGDWPEQVVRSYGDYGRLPENGWRVRIISTGKATRHEQHQYTKDRS
ncbi:MAG: hypothetical protein QF879_11715, partial [Candidatus Latescibacteria bacterium]|nr:hypothetical protein [Candidatus Latescibacterota bacterium]